MNAINILYPDGTSTGLWACSNCKHVHHAITSGIGVPSSEFNREDAERCCVDGECRFCGKPTKPETYGARGGFAYNYHNACLPQSTYRPHPSMQLPGAQQLYDAMSNISEDCWAAGWMDGTEIAIWRAIQGGATAWGMGIIPTAEILQICEEIGGWIVYDGSTDGDHDGPRFVTTAEWLPMYEVAA